ncbi:DUF2087 domain-containing protein [Streptomyces sp. RPA4-5]|uniref:DUF2087 domain-containing protein n=1 Tax=Streptomyces sp. RPA4-5 TaxID=2721245 RepID=UPI00143EC47F|nr:DUF2087 domain-containing protein [Streptomyces sp. RPA4-5]QIY58997.1 DUF2087 domain-containing protein [Streptomyces sp. RPA4-5]
MTAQTIVGTLADSVRLRVFSAIVLGATTPPDAARAAGTEPKETAAAVRKLVAGGLVTEEAGELQPNSAHFRAAARPAATAEPAASGDPEAALLRTFVVDGRLRSLPAQLTRRRAVLSHLARSAFAAGRTYNEPAVNDLLRTWCEGSGTDHVAVRRYLIELQILDRDTSSRYWLRDETAQRD